jgi:hypothetical protein
MRDYFHARSPRWTILTVYVPDQLADDVLARFTKNPGTEVLRDYYADNPYQFDLWRDARFQRNYVHVRTWPRSAGYYLSLFRRKDLWDQVPGEVVLDAVPAGLAGERAKLSDGLELLGSEVAGEAMERHELFVTTWWRVPGPMAKELDFFVDLERPGYLSHSEHVPGDWMYPADRWRPGDIVEDRVLVQLPVEMKPGDYQVYVGVSRHTTGARLAVLDGPGDGANRLRLGPLHVKTLVPMIHQLIPPPRVAEQRRHPERIPH